jgi:biotin transport system substrate-specific component
MKNKFTTVELVMMAMFAAILCVSAYISIPTPLPNAAHITLLNFVILLIALLFQTRDSAIIIALWMILGAIGVPVYIGGGSGLGYLFGVFGGYTFSFIIAAVFAGLTKGKKYNRIRYTIVAIASAMLIDLIGMLWWKFNGNLTWKVAFLSGFVAFLPLDLIKAVIAAQVVPLFNRLLDNNKAYTAGKATTENN